VQATGWQSCQHRLIVPIAQHFEPHIHPVGVCGFHK
jgi:hypothetical protein